MTTFLSSLMVKTDSKGLPLWACVGSRRLAHIERVTSLLRAWSAAMRLDADEANAWIDAGAWHDSLRDAPEELLRSITHDNETPEQLLHGPAAATRLAADGETRQHVLEAIRYHTVGSANWGRTGKALYM
ncbi:MAG: hypothetical protein ACSLFK_16155, partial [Gemmatimonadaceae bacterium]